MVKGNGLYQMETSMKGNGSLEKNMDKGPSIGLMGTNMKVSGKMG